jgi:DNA-directed RNA polymerase subunit F
MFFKKFSETEKKQLEECVKKITLLEKQNAELTVQVLSLQRMSQQTNASLRLISAAHQQLTVDMQIIYDSLREAMELVSGDIDSRSGVFWGWSDDDDDGLPN